MGIPMHTRILAGLLAVLLFSGTAAAQNCNANPFTLTNGQPADATQVMANFNNALACAALLQVRAPAGRLTLATGTPVMTSDVAGATTVFFTPYNGRAVPIWNGSFFVMIDTGGELSQATTDTTKSPAAVAANSNYDVFVWNDSGTIRATRGPAWTSDTARGTGVGTTELQLLNGFWVNRNAIANGPGANLGTYVGTIRSNALTQIDMKFGSIAAGGGAAVIGIWNAYNRVMLSFFVADATPSWTYNSATFRPADNSVNNRISMVRGLNEDGVNAVYSEVVDIGLGIYAAVFIGLDSTSTLATQANGADLGNAAGFEGMTGANYAGYPGLGFHFLQALERVNGSGTATFYGTYAPLNANNQGLSGSLRW
jgi:hypothetical protein